MSLLKAYLSRPSTQRALNRKPGQDGFSLIELVVVVAVLAILSAIAIPQFSQLSDDARLNSTKSIMANMYKECEFNKARTGTGFHTQQVTGTPNGVNWGGDSVVAAVDGTGCDAKASAKMGSASGSGAAGCIIAMSMADGTTSFENADAIPVDGSGDWTAGFPANTSDCT
jgi:prepilin-type N-terminal cleavage/methylation domain-containing protein